MTVPERTERFDILYDEAIQGEVSDGFSIIDIALGFLKNHEISAEDSSFHTERTFSPAIGCVLSKSHFFSYTI